MFIPFDPHAIDLDRLQLVDIEITQLTTAGELLGPAKSDFRLRVVFSQESRVVSSWEEELDPCDRFNIVFRRIERRQPRIVGNQLIRHSSSAARG